MSTLPALVVALWLTATLLWWGLAFMPLPSAPPEWLSAARAVCFGSVESGLPAPYGWMVLVLGPASFLVGILALWGSELGGSLRRVVRSPFGSLLFAAIASAVIVEGVWVATKLRAGLAIAAWEPDAQARSDLPAAYPRQLAEAPDFTLVDQHGERISLRRFKGRPIAVTFVFAHCQTMCPLIVRHLKESAPRTPAGAVLLITLDPWRDTPSSLAGIARQWELPESFHVLSSPRAADVLNVVEAYHVPFDRNEKTGEITHPGLVFLVDAQGRLGYTFNNPPPGWIRQGLGRLVTEAVHAG